MQKKARKNGKNAATGNVKWEPMLSCSAQLSAGPITTLAGQPMAWKNTLGVLECSCSHGSLHMAWSLTIHIPYIVHLFPPKSRHISGKIRHVYKTCIVCTRLAFLFGKIFHKHAALTFSTCSFTWHTGHLEPFSANEQKILHTSCHSGWQQFYLWNMWGTGELYHMVILHILTHLSHVLT